MLSDRRLDVLIATHGQDGLRAVADMALPRVEGVNYVVTWQIPSTDGIAVPAELRREDVEVHPSPTVGSGVNHNIGIAHARAPLCLIADNDLRYTPAQLRAVIEAFDRRPEVELAVFLYEGADRAMYPTAETDITDRLPGTFVVTAFQMAFRLAAVRGRVEFNPLFGVGARYECAEDMIFLQDCRRAGLRCHFFPVEITAHPHPSTGLRRITKPSVAQGEGAYLRHVYGLPGLPRIPLFLWRHRRRISPLWGLRHLLAGYFSYRRPVSPAKK